MHLMFQLPYPPSVNHYFVERVVFSKKSGKHIVLKHLGHEGMAYRKAVLKAALVQRVRVHTLSGRLAMTILAYPPDRRTRDLGNLDKALCDALQHAGIIADDGDIDDLHYVRGGVFKGGRVTVRIEEIAGAATTSKELFSEEAAA